VVIKQGKYGKEKKGKGGGGGGNRQIGRPDHKLHNLYETVLTSQEIGKRKKEGGGKKKAGRRTLSIGVGIDHLIASPPEKRKKKEEGGKKKRSDNLSRRQVARHKYRIDHTSRTPAHRQ